MGFYMVLSSNVDSYKAFGITNKISEFKTKLGRNIFLEGEWQVGLADISYTKSWFNILKSHKITLFDNYGKEYLNNPPDKKLIIPAGYYETPQKLIDEINRLLSQYKILKVPIVVYNEIYNSCHIKAGKIEVELGKVKDIKIVFPYFGQEIEDILGLTDRKIHDSLYTINNQTTENSSFVFKRKENNKEILKSFNPVEISGGYHSLYLYTDVVYPSLVGDSFAQLLRVIEVPRKYKFGETVNIKYEKPHYYPLMLNNFETISISIKDDSNNLIPFKFGRCTLVLHFKKV